MGDRSGGGPVVLPGSFGAEPDLDRMAGQSDVVLGQWKRLPGGHQELEPDQVEARHHLGHAVLDLEAGVHFEEVETTLVDEVLDGARHPRSRRRPPP